MEQKASVGRIVHFQPDVTLTGLESNGNPPGDGSMVDMTLFDTDAVYPLRLKGIWFSETPKPGHWNWPPRT